MECEDQLLNFLLKSPNSGTIKAIAEQLEFEHSFSLTKIEIIYMVSGSLGGLVLKVLF